MHVLLCPDSFKESMSAFEFCKYTSAYIKEIHPDWDVTSIPMADGQVLQGWIMEITEDGLVISTKEGERGVDVHVRLSDINLESLTYWDARLQAWQDFAVTM